MGKRLVQLTDDAVATVSNYGSEELDGLVAFASLKVEHVDWIIPGLIPSGMLTVLAGEQGLGKSLLHARWASELSKQELPSVLVSAEDSPTHTTKARLIAAGANEEIVYHATILPVLGNGSDPKWLARMTRWILNTDARLLVLDPLAAFLDANSDSYKDQHVRRVLSSLDAISQETGCAIVYVMHLTKGSSGNPLTRVQGSVAFTAAARSVLVLAPADTPAQPERILAHVKCNVAEKAVPQRWEIEPILIPGLQGKDVKTARISYRGDDASIDAYTLLVPRESDEEAGAVKTAEELIHEYLYDSPIPSTDLERALREAGVSPRTYDRARASMGVRAHKRGKVWYSQLPESVTKEGRQMKDANEAWRPSLPNENADEFPF